MCSRRWQFQGLVATRSLIGSEQFDEDAILLIAPCGRLLMKARVGDKGPICFRASAQPENPRFRAREQHLTCPDVDPRQAALAPHADEATALLRGLPQAMVCFPDLLDPCPHLPCIRLQNPAHLTGNPA